MVEKNDGSDADDEDFYFALGISGLVAGFFFLLQQVVDPPPGAGFGAIEWFGVGSFAVVWIVFGVNRLIGRLR